MDIVIPLGNGSLHNNLELRYCLRSIEKHLEDHGNIFIIGIKPGWIENIIHIPAYDQPGLDHKERNIFRKIMMACDDQRVSDDFYFFNDDHFLLNYYHHVYHYCGLLIDSLNKRTANHSYKKTLVNTLRVLGDKARDFDGHCPIIFNKELFMRSVGSLPWNVAGGYAIKSVYCNMNGIEGCHYPDLKIKMNFRKEQIDRLIHGRSFFSIGDTAVNDAMKEVLGELYPERSCYEVNSIMN